MNSLIFDTHKFNHSALVAVYRSRTFCRQPLSLSMKILKRVTMYLLLLTILLSSTAFLVLLLPSFGESPGKDRQRRLALSPNYKDGKFVNLLETPVMHPDASYWKMIKQQFSRGENRVPLHPIPVLKRDLHQQAPAGKWAITWFGHSTLLVQLAGKTILVDPVLSQRASPFQFVGPQRFAGTHVYRAADFPAIDYLLITHDHFDHLDHQTIVDLAPKVGHFYVPLGVGAHLEKWGVPPHQIRELDWWEEVPLSPGLLLAATPARHFSGRGLNRNETLWASYVLKAGGQALYLGGDSGYGPHFKDIGEKYGPFALTLLECGQYNGYWPNIHMMPEETAQAHLDLRGQVLMPIHWGKFKLALHSWTEPVERLVVKARELGIQTIMPVPGAQVLSDTPVPTALWWQRKHGQGPEDPSATRENR
jgi:L-ascorbate metabolism protein UlaG (beta-lactamase superfamily)